MQYTTVIQRGLKHASILLIPVVLVGCVSIGANVDPVQLFRLQPVSDATGNAEPRPLRVTVSSGSLLNSQRLWVIQSGNRIAGFKDARWAMPLPELWQETLIRSLEQSKAAIVVADGSEYASLDVALRDFQIEASGSSTEVKIALQVTLDHPDEEEQHQLFYASSSADLSSAVNVSSAFDTANQTATTDIVEWVASRLQ